MTVNLLIVEPHEIVRAGVRLGAENAGFTIAAETGEIGEALGLVIRHRPDVVLVDLPMRNGHALEAMAEIRSQLGGGGLLVYSAYDNPCYFAKAVAAGAAGYILKSRPLADLVEAIRKAAQGDHSWTTMDLRRASAAASKQLRLLDVEAPLTDRELEILTELARGATNEKIAASLGLSHETIKEHVQHILRKIFVTCRTQAAVWAVRNGLA
jgi:DNA-binding NarL/FixJ family response regulator